MRVRNQIALGLRAFLVMLCLSASAIGFSANTSDNKYGQLAKNGLNLQEGFSEADSVSRLIASGEVSAEFEGVDLKSLLLEEGEFQQALTDALANTAELVGDVSSFLEKQWEHQQYEQYKEDVAANYN